MNILIALLSLVLPILLIVLLFLAVLSIRVVPEYRRLVVFRGGRYVATRGPGFVFVLPVVEKASAVDLREQMRSVASFRNPTRDGAQVSASLDYYFKVADPQLAAASPTAAGDSLLQAAILDELSAAIRSQALTAVLQNEQLADEVRSQLAARTRSWGIELTRLHLRDLRQADGP